MRYTDLHKWDVSPKEAVLIQKKIRDRILLKPLEMDKIHLIAGVDVSVKEGFSKAAIVVLSYPGLEKLEQVTRKRKTSFPYVPGLLTFREGPVILECLETLSVEPDLFIFDGQGLAHPRRTGLASHMGVIIGKPSIGSAKSHLYGDFTPPGTERGDRSIITDTDGTPLGAVLRTRRATKPVYVSPGNLSDINTSVEMILSCSPRYKIPEPIRAAHQAASLVRK
ncbi:MAG: endonuclease V [Candidatus Omnitrophica bacterium]|nr:endonuclease V [Candidatus Omnitrophota bacterium]